MRFVERATAEARILQSLPSAASATVLARIRAANRARWAKVRATDSISAEKRDPLTSIEAGKPAAMRTRKQKAGFSRDTETLKG